MLDQTQTPFTPVKKRRLSTASLVIILAAVCFLFGYLFGFFAGPSRNQLSQVANKTELKASADQGAQSRNLDFSLFWQVWDKLEQEYVDHNKLDSRAMIYGAIRGMVAAVGDPHTMFFDPEQNKEFNQELNGSFEGIGAELGLRDGQLVIIAPLAGAPAEKAGIKAGDIILAIDGTDTYNMTIDQAISKIRGKKGTKVILTVMHEKADITSEITITRASIEVPVLKWEKDDQGIVILRLYSFNKDSAKKFYAALTEIIKQDPKGLIVDLRNNPGGFLGDSVTIASTWVEPGKVVVREIFTDASQNNDYLAEQQIKAPLVPTVVLINEGSASASEILAGALQDYNLATIVGQKSFGKGSVQNLEELPGGASVKITVAKWLTPNGRSIQDQGIEPDVTVEPSKDATSTADLQLDKAKEIIRSKL